ncbi:rhomboid family intramembrane serine protease [Alteromonas sp. NFXS44]|uniref:rhomboid family intramembrane serine protease n=1 Tax=Alteromonas sp. NFXS44 TaxID=2818435 RepID=UPI0032DFDE41
MKIRYDRKYLTAKIKSLYRALIYCWIAALLLFFFFALDGKWILALVELSVATLLLLSCYLGCRNNKAFHCILLNQNRLIIPQIFSLKGYVCIPLNDINSIHLHKDSLTLAISAHKYPHIIIDTHSLENKSEIEVIYHALGEKLALSDRLNNSQAFAEKINSHNVWVYSLLAALMAILYALLYSNETVSDAIYLGGVGKSVIRNKDFYQFFSAIFIHVNFFHLFFNICLLAIYSKIVSVLLGNVRYCNLFFTAGITGFLVSHVFSSFDYVVGASGAIYGLIGAFFVLRVKYKTVLPPGFMITSVKIILLTILADILVSFVHRDSVDFYSHITGFYVGAAYSLLICRNNKPVPDLSKCNRLESGACLLLTSAALFSIGTFIAKLGA